MAKTRRRNLNRLMVGMCGLCTLAVAGVVLPRLIAQPPGGFPGPGRLGPQNAQPPEPGRPLTPADVQHFPAADLYDLSIVRTLFFTFPSEDWEQELEAFSDTDVQVPAALQVDGQTYAGVGVHFRGMSSFRMVPSGYKRSLNVSLDFTDERAQLYGYKTLNLLNAHEDPSFMSSVLYSQIARQYIPAPKANFVRVVINGESWGIYVNVQQFNQDFLKENFASAQGTRWKVQGSPFGDGGLRYTGDSVAEYRRRYALKSADSQLAWQDLIKLCKTLDETPAEQLAAALEPMLDLDGVLWFLALDCALINNDGYWVRASDYSIYQDAGRQFHLIPHDMNEAFHGVMGPPGGPGRAGGPPGGFFGPPGGGPPDRPGGPGGPPPGGDRAGGPGRAGGPPGGPGGPGRPRGGPGGPGGGRGGPGGGPGGPGGGRGGRPGPGGAGGLTLDPLVGLGDVAKPLRSKLLQVPALRAKYLSYVRTIAERSLTWDKLGPLVQQTYRLLKDDVAADTRKLESLEAFEAALSDVVPSGEPAGRHLSLRSFIEGRRKFLLAHAEVSKAQPIEWTRPQPEASQAKRSALAQPATGSQAGVVISEIMAANSKTAKDPQGDYDDWIELHNTSSTAIDLSGMYLTDSEQALRKWRFPEGVSLAAGNYLVLWADEDERAPAGLHLNFRLSSSGEEVYLVDRDDRGNAIIDHVKFAQQTADVAFGRQPRSDTKWGPLSPTPGADNREGE